VTQSLSGTIRSVDFETKEILFENETQMITVSFANSNVDVASVMQMIDPGSSVTLDLRGSELVAIKPLQIEPGKPEKRENQQVEWELSLAILGLASAGLVVRARSKRVDLRKKR
jgi:hypothetical protein